MRGLKLNLTRLHPSQLNPIHVLAIAGFVSGLNLRMAEPLLPMLAEDFQVNLIDASALITGFTLAYGLFQLLHGPLGDRYGKLRVIGLGMILGALFTAACALVPNLSWLMGFRFLAGMCTGVVIPMSLAYIGDQIPILERQSILARFISGILIGQGIGPLVGAIIGDTAGWRAVFSIPAIGFFFVGCLLLWLHATNHGPTSTTTGVSDHQARAHSNPITLYWRLLHQPRVRLIAAFAAIEAGVFYGCFAYLGAYMRLELAAEFTAIGLALGGFCVGGLLYSFSAKALLLRFGSPGLVKLGSAILAVALVLIPLCRVTWLVGALVIALGFGFYAMHNTLQTQGTEMAPQARGAGMALFAFFMFVAQAIGVTLIGVAIESAGYLFAFFGSALVLFLLGRYFEQWLRQQNSA